MYLDILGLVTTGRGNLIDPKGEALCLPWKKADGSPALPSEVSTEWDRVKALQSMRLRGGGFYKAGAKLHLAPEDVDAMTLAKMRSNEAMMVKWFPLFDTWPADAQLAAHSMAWAMGPAFARMFPYFTLRANVEDWAGCAQNCHMNDANNPGLVPRNKANVALFSAAILSTDPEELTGI